MDALRFQTEGWFYELISKALSPVKTIQVGQIFISPNYIHIIALLVCVFLIILAMSHMRRLEIKWSLKGALSLLFIGFLLGIAVEVLLIAKGKTIFTQFLGWDNPPKPISNIENITRDQLGKVLGESESEFIDMDLLFNKYQLLPTEEKDGFKALICK